MQDTAKWDDIVMRSIDVGSRHIDQKFFWRRYYYANASEHRLAQLLTKMRVPFTPNVKFTLRTDDGRTRIYVADFVFNAVPYIWRGNGTPELVHGLEAKAMRDGGFPKRAIENQRILCEQFGIRIPLLDDEEILRWFRQRYLPLTSL